MKRACCVLLQLYPRDYRALFHDEMKNAFESAAAEQLLIGRGAYSRFCMPEFRGLLIGTMSEWISKLTTDASIRGRRLPDRLLMRPPGVSWELHYGIAPTLEDERRYCREDRELSGEANRGCSRL